MSIETTYSNVRENLASYMDRAVDEREIIRVKRRGRGDVAIISADELDGLLETAHLLRSPKNAERLFEALYSALAQTGTPVKIEDLERQFGLDSDSE
jgi:antitoxin YefM